jgi:hypothetical protein
MLRVESKEAGMAQMTRHECECCGEDEVPIRTGTYVVGGRTFEGWRCEECADHEDVDECKSGWDDEQAGGTCGCAVCVG